MSAASYKVRQQIAAPAMTGPALAEKQQTMCLSAMFAKIAIRQPLGLRRVSITR
jgi:hypothetical protein